MILFIIFKNFLKKFLRTILVYVLNVYAQFFIIHNIRSDI